MIISCGEALIDFLPRSDAGGAAVFRPFAGGSVFNVAIALGRLGAPSGFFSGLSSDFFGDLLRDTLAKSRVDFTLADHSDRPTTLAFVTLVEGQARYAFFDEGSAGRMLTAADLPALPVAVTALHFGSFSLAAEPCGSAYEAFLQQEHKHRVISLDPNIRPTLVKNREAHVERIERLVGMSDIVKLSEEDLEWLFPGARFEEVAAAWLKRGAHIVILTRGSNGATAISRHGLFKVAPVVVAVADTIGAGDTFTAGVLAHLHKNGRLTKSGVAGLHQKHLEEALAFAAKAASVTVSRPGADPPWASEIGA